jgi:hypothetical protein
VGERRDLDAHRGDRKISSDTSTIAAEPPSSEMRRACAARIGHSSIATAPTIADGTHQGASGAATDGALTAGACRSGSRPSGTFRTMRQVQ